jgi:hypothetical protein
MPGLLILRLKPREPLSNFGRHSSLAFLKEFFYFIAAWH